MVQGYERVLVIVIVSAEIAGHVTAEPRQDAGAIILHSQSAAGAAAMARHLEPVSVRHRLQVPEHLEAIQRLSGGFIVRNV